MLVVHVVVGEDGGGREGRHVDRGYVMDDDGSQSHHRRWDRQRIDRGRQSGRRNEVSRWRVMVFEKLSNL